MRTAAARAGQRLTRPYTGKQFGMGRVWGLAAGSVQGRGSSAGRLAGGGAFRWCSGGARWGSVVRDRLYFGLLGVDDHRRYRLAPSFFGALVYGALFGLAMLA